jgi:glycosyltransferase involved in cell wall biosynthesis
VKHSSHIEPRISAVIPAFNRGRTIGRAIESALAQTRPPIEIVVVDDGSTDNTAAAVATYGDSVRYVYQPNAGASAARNRGVESATAPWVAFLDSDDYWSDDHLERMAEAISATAGAAAFYFADMVTDDGTSWWEMSGFLAPMGHCLVADATDWVLLDVQPTMLQSSVFNRERYREAGGLWTALQTRHDTHLFFLMGIGGPACAVAGAGVRMTADDQSGKRLTDEFGPTSRNWWIQTRLMYADVLNRFPGLARNHRRRLKGRLATAYQRLAQHDWGAGRTAPTMVNLIKAVHLAPWRMTVSGGRKVWRMAFVRGGRTART